MITPRSLGQTAHDAAPHRLSAALDRLPAALAVAVGAWILIAYSVDQWRSITVPSWDLAIFAELAKDYAHGRAPIVPIKGEGYNLLGDHFHPILILLGPVWRLFPTPLALLVVQDLLLAVSAWPLTRLATRLTTRLVATALGLFYVLSWGIQGAAQAQFHEIAFAVPALAWASVAFVERRWTACALWLAPLVLVKEDMGLTLVMAGGAMALRGWQDARAGLSDDGDGRPARWRPGRPVRVWADLPTAVRTGAYVALFGALAFVLTVFVIVPLLSPTGAWQYGLSGNTADGMPTAPSRGTLLDRLFSPEVKVTTLFMLVCTAGGIGLASPWMSLVLPTLGWRFLADKDAYWEWKLWHYNAVLIPIALGALLDVVARLRDRRPREARAALARAAASPPAAHRPETADDVDSALGAARAMSERHGFVAAVSGPVDAIVDGQRMARITGGSPMLTRVTGGGCALGALIAAFIAAGREQDVDARAATVACHEVYSAAAQRAAARSTGPGSFRPAFLDALYDLGAEDLEAVAVSEEQA